MERAASRDFHTVFTGGSALGVPDAALLERFVGRGDQPAFTALVQRHGPMVWRVCRSLLRDDHVAEDAFQAVFMVLARKARSLRVRDTLGPWLHEVALRTAAFARSEANRRAKVERRWIGSLTPRSYFQSHDDSTQVVQEELDKLPDRYRTVVILCDIQGVSHEEASRRLGWPIGTVKSRQSRGRNRLRERLVRRGLGPEAWMLTPLVPPLPLSLIPRTVDATAALLRAGLVPATLSAGVLMKGVLIAMRLQMLRALAAAALVPATVVSLAGLPGHAAAWQDVASPKPAIRPIRDILREASAALNPVAAEALARFALAQAQVGDRDGARESARRAAASAEQRDEADPQRQVALHLAVAWALHAGGESPDGLKQLVRVGQALDRIEDVDRRARHRRALAIALADLGDREGSMAALDSLERDVAAAAERKPPHHPVEFTNSIIATNLVEAQAAIGEYEAAFRVAEEFTEPYKNQLLGAIAETTSTPHLHRYQPRRRLTEEERKARLAIVKRVDRAVKATAYAEWRPDAELTFAFADLEEFGEALRTARRHGTGEIRSRNSNDLTSTPFLLYRIARAQTLAGRKEEARTTLREAFALIEHDPEIARVRSGQVAIGQIAAGDAEGALKTIELMHNDEGPRLLADVAVLQSRSGRAAEARATFARALREIDDLIQPKPQQPAPTNKEALSPEAPPSTPDRVQDRSLERKEQLMAEAAGIQASSGDMEGATATLRKLANTKYDATAAREIAASRVKAGDPGGALRWALSPDTPLKGSALYGLAEAIIEP